MATKSAMCHAREWKKDKHLTVWKRKKNRVWLNYSHDKFFLNTCTFPPTWTKRSHRFTHWQPSPMLHDSTLAFTTKTTWAQQICKNQSLYPNWWQNIQFLSTWSITATISPKRIILYIKNNSDIKPTHCMYTYVYHILAFRNVKIIFETYTSKFYSYFNQKIY